MTRIRPTALIATAVALVLTALPGTAHAAPPEPAVAVASGTVATDLALSSTATASSVELDRADFAPALAIDGDSSTRWSSGYTDDEWLQLEFAHASPVHSVEIDWPNACARAFTLQTSQDGQTWDEVAERSGQDTCARTDVIALDLDEPIAFLRVQGVQRWSTWGFSVSEIRVWDAPLPEQEPSLAVIPKPVSLELGQGEYRIGADAVVAASGEAAAAAELLAGVLRPATGFELPIVDSTDEPAIEIAIAAGSAPAGHADEGYVLDVDAAGIRISADTAAGALNGVQTLRQLLPAWAESAQRIDADWVVPHVSIHDYPRFEYRGLMVDTARSFYTVDEVKELIDAASPYKLNRLHIHLTDDQGWRLAMDTPSDNPSGIEFGLLTEVSGNTAMTYNGNGDLMGTELGHTGFYTKADYTEIVDYAALNGMTVVPEIDMPGHTNAALHAIPQLNSAGSTPQPQPGETTAPAQGTGDVGNSSFDANNDVTYEFISEVLRQLAELTPGQYLHIGGDEAHSTSHADYAKMVDFANAQVAGLGKTVIGWNEYAGTALPQDDAVVQFWSGGGQAVADAVSTRGAQVIMSPAHKAYFPQKQDSRQPLGGTWACGGPCTLESAYNWNPAAQIAGVGEEAVLGVEGAFWGEFIRGVDQAQFYSFPRLLAIAEAGWTPQESKNTADFLQRLADIGSRMSVQGVNFFPTATVDWSADAAATVEAPATASMRAVSAAPTTARVRWQIAAPATATGDVTATVTWSDGLVEEVELSAAGVTDIAAMTLNAVYTGGSARELTAPGTYTARLDVVDSGEPAATASATVTVQEEEQPGTGGGDDSGGGDPDGGGASTPGGSSGSGDAATGADSASSDAASLAATGGEFAAFIAFGAALVLGAVLLLIVRRRAHGQR